MASSAICRVFSTVEVLEQNLLSLSIGDIVHLRRLDKQTKAVIERCPELRRKLFLPSSLTPAPVGPLTFPRQYFIKIAEKLSDCGSAVQLNPLLCKLGTGPTTWCGAQGANFIEFALCARPVLPPFCFLPDTITGDSAELNLSSCSRMYISMPPVTTLVLYCLHTPWNKFIRNQTGITFHDIISALEGHAGRDGWFEVALDPNQKDGMRNDNANINNVSSSGFFVMTTQYDRLQRASKPVIWQMYDSWFLNHGYSWNEEEAQWKRPMIVHSFATGRREFAWIGSR